MPARLRTATTLIVLALCSTAAAGQTRMIASDQQTLIKLEQDWNDAFYHKDIAFIDRVLADEFVATYDDGTVGDKAKELALVEAFDQQVESAIPDGFTVHVYGDTAVVHFTLHLVGIRQGQRAQVDLRFTDVFVWRDERWQCVSSQSTKIPEAA